MTELNKENKEWLDKHSPVAFATMGKSDVAKKLLEMQQRIEELERDRDDLQSNLCEWNGIMLDSTGVAGYHMNGDIAEWDEFEFTQESPLLVAENYNNEMMAQGIELWINSFNLIENEEQEYMIWSAKELVKQLRNQK